MTSISDLINEGRDAPLYHSTSFARLTSILEQGIMPYTQHLKRHLLTASPAPKTQPYSVFDQTAKPPTTNPKLERGVSTTRNLRFAFAWDQVTIELDQAKLAREYRIIPLQFFQQNGTSPARQGSFGTFFGTKRNDTMNEYEEFIVTDKPIPLDRFCRAIYITNNVLHLLDKTKRLWDGPLFDYDRKPLLPPNN